MNHQSLILKKSKNFIKNGHSQNRNVEFNPNYFLTSWADSIGYLNIKTNLVKLNQIKSSPDLLDKLNKLGVELPPNF